jgi:alpha-beta hydrolase superfamily lysophospholipase
MGDDPNARAVAADDLEDVPVMDGIGTLHGVRHRHRRNKRAVVFVHGFTGDVSATWLENGASESFGALIAGDPDLADYDVYTFGYRTRLRSGSRIELLAREFNTGIDALQHSSSREGRDYSFVLLAHSMGGLVCMRYVIDRLQARQRPPLLGLLLYGTPTTGTDLVGIVKLVAGVAALKFPIVGSIVRGWFKLQHQLTDLATASTFLTGLHDQWALRVVNGGHPDANPDGRTWLPVRVVTGNTDFFVKEASSKGVYGAIDWQPVDCGHVDLVKPPTRRDPRYYHAKRFLEICRTAQRPDVQARVWNLSQAVWQTSSDKMIAKHEFETTIHSPTRTSPPGGLSVCRTSCRFRMALEAPLVTIGIAFNGIGQQER